MQEIFGDEDPFSDFFKTFFGGGAAGGGATRRRGGGGARGRGRAPAATSSSEIELTLEEAFHGATRRLSIKQDGHARTVDVRIPPA